MSSQNLSIRGACAPLFDFFWFVASRYQWRHHQVSAEGSLSSFFSFSCFVAFGRKWAPSPSFGKGGALVEIRAEKGQTKKVNLGWHRDRKENTISAPSIHVGALVGAGALWPTRMISASPEQCLQQII
jgi:hypothetical protein